VRRKRSFPPWVTHYALAPPQSVQKFINQFYSERHNVATLADDNDKKKTETNQRRPETVN
jgi:hypothetical protein